MNTAGNRETSEATDRTFRPRRQRDRSHYLYIGVVVGVAAGAAVGGLAPHAGAALGVLGTTFVHLVAMMIAPIVFCTIALGIGSVRNAATVGKVGGLALAYFLVVSTFALALGIVVDDLFKLGSGMHVTLSGSQAHAAAGLADTAQTSGGVTGFVAQIIPTSFFSSLTSGDVLQVVFVALLSGFALQAMGSAGQPILRGIEHLQTLVFKVLAMILWLAPIGAFGAIASVVGQSGWGALTELLTLLVAFYLTCAVFVFGVLGVLVRVTGGVSIVRLMQYLAREYMLCFATSSSNAAMPRLIPKMEHLGIERSTVSVVVPTGFAFNLAGTAIYITMAAVFIADALGKPMSISAQVSLLLVMVLVSKGTTGVASAGLATLAGGLQVDHPDLVEGVGLLVGIDWFMCQVRTATNFTGNVVATVCIAAWTNTLDRARMDAVLCGDAPFDELDMFDERADSSAEPAPAPAPAC